MQHFLKQFNWRFLLVRILVNAIALDVTAAIVPRITLVDQSIGNWILMGIMLGVLNALVKPVLQFLTLPFLFVSYGLVLVVVNALILLLLSFLFPNRFAVDNLLWALVGGLVLGLLSSFLESLMGLTKPIVPDERPAVRRQVQEQARHVEWLAVAGSGTVPEQQPATEPPDGHAQAAEPAVSDPAVGESAASLDALAEPPGPGPDGRSLPPTEIDAEPPDSVAVSPAEPPISAEVDASVDPEPVLEPQEEQREDRS